MTTTALIDTAQALVAGDKGLLAIDESIATCNGRFAALGIAQTEPSRRAYRELIVTAPALGESISGLILCDETIRQRTADEIPFTTVLAEAGILIGIKVGRGATAMAGDPDDKVTDSQCGVPGRSHRTAPVGAVVLLRPSLPAARPADLARPRQPGGAGPAGAASSCRVQPGCSQRRRWHRIAAEFSHDDQRRRTPGSDRRPRAGGQLP